MGDERFVDANGVRLFVREMGETARGHPPLLVIHGGPDWDHSYLLPGIEPVSTATSLLLICAVAGEAQRDSGRTATSLSTS